MAADLAKKRPRGGMLKRNAHAQSGPRREFLAFLLAGETYAAPVKEVREIVKPPPLTPVPRAPEATMGIVSVRGQLVTVIDLRRRLRLTESQASRRTRILLVEAPWGELLGLYVDEVQQVYRLSDAEVEPAASALGGDVASYIAGIARPLQPSVEGGGSAHPPVIVLLDLQAILAS
ncbi:chemotaxis protein CheW [Chondromyces apiculatus]|uniref:Positive regulator of CheA protein activity (CheW) n=1 Tax=Chondromyces apiculatus DSM 436 TaxID=1192034 RepID=A0A017SVL1_9BACT|nr:chemotaxis protein CheW [Chondromyces apiculatus]EYF00346.1 Positive regulator of CheA protein activity (CheW) [Chondromyces apiculatus DSM 436]